MEPTAVELVDPVDDRTAPVSFEFAARRERKGVRGSATVTIVDPTPEWFAAQSRKHKLESSL